MKRFIIQFLIFLISVFVIQNQIANAYISLPTLKEKTNKPKYESAKKQYYAPNSPINPEVDYAPYMKSLQSKVRNNWRPIKSNTSYSTQLQFRINRKGELVDLKVSKSSGESKYDQEALEAVKRSAPFGNLPEKHKGEFVDIQFTLDYNVWSSRTNQKQ